MMFGTLAWRENTSLIIGVRRWPANTGSFQEDHHGYFR
jgi:hypothetical protein